MDHHRSVPPGYPHTASAMLLARGGDPLAHAAAGLTAARRTIVELLGLLPADQEDLAGEFRGTIEDLEHGLARLNSWQISPQRLVWMRRYLPGIWGEPLLHTDVWVGTAPAFVQQETVYGFRTAMPVLLDRLHQATRALDQPDIDAADGPRILVLVASMAEFAARVQSAVMSFTAAVWEYEQPTALARAPDTAQVRIRSGAHAPACTRWARQAEVLFAPPRVEVTTSTGRHIIGENTPIAGLVHVVPPSPRAVLMPYEPSESYEPLALQDDLGVLHFCSAQGYSLGAVMVADWLAQPELQTAQYRLTSPSAEASPARDLLVWGLQVSGFADGAATLDLPIRRGVLHPPPAAPLPVSSAQHDFQYTMPPQIPLLRAGPHHQPYRGTAASPAAARTRRKARLGFWNKDTGPASPINLIVRAGAPAAAWLAGLGTAYLFAGTWWAQLALLWVSLAVCEPWVWWAWERFRDRRTYTVEATYRPGAYPFGTRAFATRAALIFDGTDVGLRGPFGHMAWTPGPGQHNGVDRLQQLADQDGPWAVALVDGRGHWRLVLPIQQWAPRGDLSGLAGFAHVVGLSVEEAYARRMAPTADVFDAASPATRRESNGPAGRGMVLLGLWCALVVPLTWWGWHVATALMITLAAGAAVPVAIRAWWIRYQRRRT